MSDEPTDTDLTTEEQLTLEAGAAKAFREHPELSEEVSQTRRQPAQAKTKRRYKQIQDEFDDPYAEQVRLIGREVEQIQHERKARAEQGRLRRLQRENRFERKIQPFTFQIRAVPYVPVAVRGLANATRNAQRGASRFLKNTRSEYLRHKYKIQPSTKSANPKPRKVVLSID